MILPIALLLLQPTKFCNIDCRYCYLPNRAIKGNMALDVVRAVCENLLVRPYVDREVEICMHGGEPLAAGLQWYRDATKTISEVLSETLLVRYSMQTNAMLLNDDWAQLIIERNIKIGVSLDGPAALHNIKRVTRSGEGTFDQAMNGIGVLKRNKIPFSLLCVLHEGSLDAPEELFEFFCQVAPREVAFNVEELEGMNQKTSFREFDTKRRSRSFFKKYWDLSEQYGYPHDVREFKHMGTTIAGALMGHSLSNQMIEPLCCVSVATNGDYATFAPELLETETGQAPTVLGNVLTHPLASVVSSEHFLALWNQIRLGVENCRSTCSYFRFCGGGSPANKFFELGSFEATETAYCRNSVQALCDEGLHRIATVLTNREH